MNLGLIDLGSNSARMYLVSLTDTGYEILTRRRVMTRLSEGMGEERILKEPAISRTIDALGAFATELAQADAVPFAVATAAVRRAKNQQEFLAWVKQDVGFSFFVLSGETEAFFDFQGVMASLPSLADCLICDTGGGSTELILARNGFLKDKISLPFGAMTLTEAYGAQPIHAEKEILSWFNNIPFLLETKGLPLVGIGGSVSAFGCLDKGNRDIHGHRIPAPRCRELFATLLPLSPEERVSSGVEPGRADSICAGFLPSLLLLEQYSLPHLTLCTAGLREGILAELTKDNPKFYAKNPELFLKKYV